MPDGADLRLLLREGRRWLHPPRRQGPNLGARAQRLASAACLSASSFTSAAAAPPLPFGLGGGPLFGGPLSVALLGGDCLKGGDAGAVAGRVAAAAAAGAAAGVAAATLGQQQRLQRLQVLWPSCQLSRRCRCLLLRHHRWGSPPSRHALPGAAGRAGWGLLQHGGKPRRTPQSCAWTSPWQRLS